jgi:hypothetical protein
MNKNIFIIHNNWKGKCIIENNKIYRVEDKDEYGCYNIDKNKLTITWDKWNEEIFYCNDNQLNIYYVSNIYEMEHENIIIYDNENSFLLILYKKKGKCTIWELKMSGNYSFQHNILILKLRNITNKYIKFYDNIYHNNYKNNISIIQPNTIYFNNIILFSNITLCKKNIIFTSIYYVKNPFNIEDIVIIVKNENIIKKHVYNNDNIYEPSLSIILELENITNNINIIIEYKNRQYEVFLEQLQIIDHHISAMTLFKDDYYLLNRYLKYYEDLGVNIFYIYYNNKIDYKIIDQIQKLNVNQSKIYLTEWNYIYWLKYDNTKQHFAQTMAINDSLHILKNYSNYILYNDLDEYFLLDTYNNLNDLINKNKDIDIFVFKNRFCKMGNELIKYKDFDEKFNLSNIIEGNYWDKYREKNLIKCENINVMGVHSYFKNFSQKEIKDKVVDQFYHIINFEEKHRDILMTKYIS